MVGIILSALAVITPFFDLGAQSDFNLTGTQTISESAVFRITDSTLTNSGEKIISDINNYNTIEFTQMLILNDYYFSSSENGLSITSSCYISTNNQDYTLLSVDTYSQYDISYYNQSRYMQIELTNNTDNYYNTLAEYQGAYIKFEVSIYAENIVMDSDANFSTIGERNNRVVALVNYKGDYQEGYTNGYQEGSNDGYREAYDSQQSIIDRLNEDYRNLNQRFRDYVNGRTSFSALVWNIASTPFESFKTIWDVDLLGINVGNFVIGLMFVGIILWAWKKFF